MKKNKSTNQGVIKVIMSTTMPLIEAKSAITIATKDWIPLLSPKNFVKLNTP